MKTYPAQEQANETAKQASFVKRSPQFVYQVKGGFVVVEELGTAQSNILTACFKGGNSVGPLEAISGHFVRPARMDQTPKDKA